MSMVVIALLATQTEHLLESVVHSFITGVSGTTAMSSETIAT